MPNYAPQSDVTGQVNLTHPGEVADVVCHIIGQRYPGFDATLLRLAFRDIEAAFWGRYDGLLPCDTPYHDLRHSLATSLLMARMVDGHALAHPADMPSLDADEAALAVLLALYHDIGFLRRTDEAHLHGASLLREHEQRGVDFMRTYLAGGAFARLAAQAELIHTTNFAKPLAETLDGRPPTMQLIGKMLGTADLVSQVSSRYYLERCRCFLYEEFVIAGADRMTGADGKTIVLYASAEDLLRKTPGFFEQVVRKRIEGMGDLYRCVAAHFGGDDPYERGMQRNMAFLKETIERNDFSRLARKPLPLMPLPA